MLTIAELALKPSAGFLSAVAAGGVARAYSICRAKWPEHGVPGVTHVRSLADLPETVDVLYIDGPLRLAESLAEADRHPDKYRRREVTAGIRPACRFLGAATGETLPCETCPGRVGLKTFACGAHGTCTIGKRHEKAGGCCKGCRQYEAAE